MRGLTLRCFVALLAGASAFQCAPQPRTRLMQLACLGPANAQVAPSRRRRRLPKTTSLHSHDLRVAVPEMSLLSQVTPMIKNTGGGLAFLGLSRPKGIVVLAASGRGLIVRMRRDQDADAEQPATPVAAEYAPEPVFAPEPAAPPMPEPPAPPAPPPPTAWTSQVSSAPLSHCSPTISRATSLTPRRYVLRRPSDV